MSFSKAYNQLNEKQRQAASAIEGPVMLLAGPGTGKTQTLAIRIANILDKTDARPENILALTFTESAASNMRKRLHDNIGIDAYKIKITTFHSFCNEIIQLYPEKFSFSDELTQATELDKIKYLQRILDTIEIDALKTFGSNYYYQSEIIRSISKLKQEGVTPDKFQTLLEETRKDLEAGKEINPRTGKPKSAWTRKYNSLEKNLDLEKIYREYEKVLNNEGKYDFDDMILFIIGKLEEDSDLLADLQEQFLYILVDEFQDTNGAQSSLLTKLGSFDDKPNIFVVGDDDQSIFRFQGANVENMKDFLRDFPDTQIITLDKSYRCPQKILDGSNSLIKHNKSRLVNVIEGLEKELKSQNISESEIILHEFENSDYENQWILEDITKKIKKGEKPEDFAILYRNHKDSEDLQRLFLASNIIINSQKDTNLLEEEYVQKLINLLKVICNQDNSELLFEILNYKFLNINRLETFKLARASYKSRKEIIDEILDTDTDASIQEFLDQLTHWKQESEINHTLKFVEIVIHESNILDFLLKKKDTKAVESIKSFFTLAKNLSLGKHDYKLKDFLVDLDLIKENKLNINFGFKKENNGVNFMTVHKSKGLEFKHVYIIRLVDKLWGNKTDRSKLKLPSNIFDSSEIEDLDANEEERRLLYVALTRAKESVSLTYSNKYIEDNQEKEKVPSQFTHEIGKDYKSLKIHDSEENPTISISLLQKLPELNLIEEEKAYLRSLLEDFKLSITALENYLESPRKFLYKSLIKVPAAKTKYLVLGTIVHKALEVWNQNQLSGNTKDLSYYIKVMKNAINKEHVTKEEESQIITEAIELFSNYFKFLSSGKLKDVVKSEYNFASHNVMLEDINLTGKIDKIEWLDKEVKNVRIIDYKTGSAKSRNQILGETKTSDGRLYRQLAFYKLLTELDDRFPYTASEFSLDFIKPTSSGKYKNEVFSSDEINTEEIKELIKEYMKKIRNLEFDD